VQRNLAFINMASKDTLLHTIKVNRRLRKLKESLAKSKQQKTIANGK